MKSDAPTSPDFPKLETQEIESPQHQLRVQPIPLHSPSPFQMSAFPRIPLRRLCQPRLSRAIQTSADTTQLHHPPPTDSSQPFTVQLHQDSFRTYNCDMPNLHVQVTKDQLLSMYKQMQTMRRMEMAADALYKAKLIRGFCHLAIGQVRISFQIFKKCISFERVCRKLYPSASKLVSNQRIASSPLTDAILSPSCAGVRSKASSPSSSVVRQACPMVKAARCTSSPRPSSAGMES